MNRPAERKIVGKSLKSGDFSFPRRGNLFDEQTVNGRSAGEFGMERRGHMTSLLHQHRVTVITHENMRVAAGFPNHRSANKHRLQGLATEFKMCDTAINLPAIGIAFDDKIHQLQRVLRWVSDFFRKENRSGAGA